MALSFISCLMLMKPRSNAMMLKYVGSTIITLRLAARCHGHARGSISAAACSSITTRIREKVSTVSLSAPVADKVVLWRRAAAMTRAHTLYRHDNFMKVEYQLKMLSRNHRFSDSIIYISTSRPASPACARNMIRGAFRKHGRHSNVSAIICVAVGGMPALAYARRASDFVISDSIIDGLRRFITVIGTRLRRRPLTWHSRSIVAAGADATRSAPIIMF